MLFNKKRLIWKSYIIIKALPTPKKVQIIDIKYFVIAALDANSKIFIVHMAIWKQEKIPVYSEWQG